MTSASPAVCPVMKPRWVSRRVPRAQRSTPTPSPAPGACQGAEWETARVEAGRLPENAELRSGERFLEVLVDLVEKARRRQPPLVRTDEKGEVLRHVARF